MDGLKRCQVALWCGVVLVLVVAASASQDYTFDEEFLVRPLKDGRVLVHWQFVTRWHPEAGQIADRAKHFGLFPKTLGQIVQRFSVQELHLSLTQGRWDYAQWGRPLLPAPVGAELWSWLQPSAERDVGEQWKGLTHALSGLMCGSLNLIDTKSTCQPNAFFRPSSPATADQASLRYGALPREAVCTENLTPWTKLLPCRLKAGLGSLINPVQLADSRFRSLTLNVLVNGTDMELVQTLSVVLAPSSPGSSDQLDLQSVLGSTLQSSCPLAGSSAFYVDTSLLPASSDESAPSPTRGSVTRHNASVLADTFHLQTGGRSLQEAGSERAWPEDKLHVHRYTTGHGQQEGGLSIELHNGNDVPLTANVLQVVPAYVRLYFHTLSILLNDTELNAAERPKVLTHQWVRPAEDRAEPAHMELSLTLPPHSKIGITLQFEKVFLHFAEYPPDPHRGMHIPAALVAYTLGDAGEAWRKGWPFTSASVADWLQPRNYAHRYSEVVVVNLPTPDFSMPYNVMTLTGAVMALLFASIFKLLTGPPKSSKPPAPSWWQSLLARLRKTKQA